jgi:hypothetical protein
VEPLVDGEEAVRVLGRGFELGMDTLEFAQLGLGGRGGDDTGRVAFQQRQEVVDLLQVLVGNFGDVGAAAHLHGHQAFGRQHLQRLAQRRAADAVFLRQLDLVDPAARLQFAPEDPLAQLLRHLFIEGAGGDGDGGHAADLS